MLPLSIRVVMGLVLNFITRIPSKRCTGRQLGSKQIIGLWLPLIGPAFRLSTSCKFDRSKENS